MLTKKMYKRTGRIGRSHISKRTAKPKGYPNSLLRLENKNKFEQNILDSVHRNRDIQFLAKIYQIY